MTPETRGNPAMLTAALVCAVIVVVLVFFAKTAQCQDVSPAPSDIVAPPNDATIRHVGSERGRPRAFTFALVTMGVGQGLDTLSTIAALNRGAVEASPILGAHPSAAKLIAAKLPMVGVGWLLTKIAPKHPKLAAGTAFTIGAVGGALAVHNMRQGRPRS